MENDNTAISEPSIDTEAGPAEDSAGGTASLQEESKEGSTFSEDLREGTESDNEDTIQDSPVSSPANRVLAGEADNPVTENESAIEDTGEIPEEERTEQEVTETGPETASPGESFEDMYNDQFVLMNETLTATQQELVSLHEDIGLGIALLLFVVIVIILQYIYRFFNMFF